MNNFRYCFSEQLSSCEEIWKCQIPKCTATFYTIVKDNLSEFSTTISSLLLQKKMDVDEGSKLTNYIQQQIIRNLHQILIRLLI